MRHIFDADEVIAARLLPELEDQSPRRQGIICWQSEGVRREILDIEVPPKFEKRANSGQVCVVSDQTDKITIRIGPGTLTVQRQQVGLAL